MARSQAFLAECPAIGRERSPHAPSSSPSWRIHRGSPQRRPHDHRGCDVDHPVHRLGQARPDRPGVAASPASPNIERLYGGLHTDDAATSATRVRALLPEWRFRRLRPAHRANEPTMRRQRGCRGAAFGDLTVSASSPGVWATRFQRPRDTAPGRRDPLHASKSSSRRQTTRCWKASRTSRLTALIARFAPNVINGRSAFIDELDFASDPPASADRRRRMRSTGGADGDVLAPNDADVHTRRWPQRSPSEASPTASTCSTSSACPGLTDPTAIGDLQTRARERRAFLIVDCDRRRGSRRRRRRWTPPSPAPMRRNSAHLLPLGARAPIRCSRTRLRTFPPCGFVAGVYGAHRRDARRLEGAGRHRGQPATARSASTITHDRRRERPAQSARRQLPAHLPGLRQRRAGARARCDGADDRGSRMEIRAGAAHGAVPRGEPLPRHASGWCSSPTTSRCGRRSGSTSAPSCRTCSARARSRARRRARPISSSATARRRRRPTSTSASSTSWSASRR